MAFPGMVREDIIRVLVVILFATSPTSKDRKSLLKTVVPLRRNVTPRLSVSKIEMILPRLGSFGRGIGIAPRQV